MDTTERQLLFRLEELVMNFVAGRGVLSDVEVVRAVDAINDYSPAYGRWSQGAEDPELFPAGSLLESAWVLRDFYLDRGVPEREMPPVIERALWLAENEGLISRIGQGSGLTMSAAELAFIGRPLSGEPSIVPGWHEFFAALTQNVGDHASDIVDLVADAVAGQVNPFMTIDGESGWWEADTAFQEGLVHEVYFNGLELAWMDAWYGEGGVTLVTTGGIIFAMTAHTLESIVEETIDSLLEG